MSLSLFNRSSLSYLARRVLSPTPALTLLGYVLHSTYGGLLVLGVLSVNCLTAF